MSRIPGQPQKPKPRPRGDIEWRELALCRQTDPEIFFPDHDTHSSRDAKKICAACPVTVECLRYAITHRERYGVWGGLGEKERRYYGRGVA